MKQLRLLPVARPLNERFGAAFFRTIPRLPGVYQMRDEAGRLLYVGQSGDLRARLSSYRHIHPERDSRRLVRLVFAVRSITWEITESVAASRLRENELLRTLKPRWNIQNTRPEHYAFFGVRAAGDTLDLRLTKTPDAEPEEALFGAFKGINRARHVMASLQRLLWSTLHLPQSPHDLPLPLNRSRPPERWEFTSDHAPAIARSLVAYLSGESASLIDLLGELLLRDGEPPRFQGQFHDADLENLLLFYRFGPERNARLRAALPEPVPLIPKEQLDDLITAARPD